MNKSPASSVNAATLVCAVLLLVTSGACQEQANAAEPLVVHFIDVGQGDAALVDYGDYEMLIDGGRYSSTSSHISAYVDGELEVVVATHPDADHIGGLAGVLDAFAVGEIWLNGDNATTQTYATFMSKVSAEGAQVRYAQRGDQINLSTLTLSVLNPDLPLGSDANDNSIVLELSFGQVDLLFTGDAGTEAETAMLASGLIGDIDILKVSHHGSKYASTTEFLAAARPEAAVYSAGSGNSYGHPAPETIARLEAAGATVFGTDVFGTISITTGGTSYSVHVTNAATGDTNSDGQVTALDVTRTKRIIVGLDAAAPGADANLDGKTNALDIATVKRIIAGLD